jgi:hypothetical protein
MWKAAEKARQVVEWLKNTRARKLRPVHEYPSHPDEMTTIASNRAITTLDVSECAVRMYFCSLISISCADLIFRDNCL